MARVSICLPVLNGEAFVGKALESIAAQSFGDYVVVASDNASSDGTSDILRDWSTKIPMQIVRQSETLPMMEHFNSLLDRVDTAAYMLLCHDDYFFSTQAIEIAEKILREHPSISAVYSDLVYVSEHGHPLAHRKFRRSGEQRADTLGAQTLRSARNMFGIPVLVRTTARGSHRYDTRLHYLADADLSWRISQQAPLWHVPDVMLANRYNGRNSTWSLLRDAKREFLLMAEKHSVSMPLHARFRLAAMNWQISRQKQLFGLYERLVTRLG